MACIWALLHHQACASAAVQHSVARSLLPCIDPRNQAVNLSQAGCWGIVGCRTSGYVICQKTQPHAGQRFAQKGESGSGIEDQTDWLGHPDMYNCMTYDRVNAIQIILVFARAISDSEPRNWSGP